MELNDLDKKLKEENNAFDVKPSLDFNAKVISQIETDNIQPDEISATQPPLINVAALLLFAFGGLLYISLPSPKNLGEKDIVSNGNQINQNQIDEAITNNPFEQEVQLLKEGFGNVTDLIEVYAEVYY